MFPISIILPTYNRLERLKLVLDGLEKQDFPPSDFEVIVVSDGSVDGTDEFLQTTKTRLHLKPILQPNQGPAVARNNGLAEATGKTVVFIDDDVVPSPQLLSEHVKWHEEHGEQVVVLGPMLTPPDHQMSIWVQWEQTTLYKQYQDMLTGKYEPTGRQFYTGNTSLARRHLVESGGFDPAFRRAEDVELAYRLAKRNLRFLYNPKAIGWHYAERSFESWLETAYVYGRNDVIFANQKGHRWLLDAKSREYSDRHHYIRWMTRLCLDRQLMSKITMTTLRRVAEIGHKTGVDSLPHAACSGIYNLRHFQGMADELGGRQAFYYNLTNGYPAAEPVKSVEA